MTNLYYLLGLISNPLSQLEQSSFHPQQFPVVASCYRPPATTISVFSYTSTAPEKENRSSNRLGTLAGEVEKPEGPSALQPTTEIKFQTLLMKRKLRRVTRSRRLQAAHLVSCIIRGGMANINFVHSNRA